DGLTSLDDIFQRLLHIAASKAEQVQSQCSGSTAAILCADTTIIVPHAELLDETYRVLGQPPEPEWREIVAEWFRTHYSGKTHLAATAFVITSPAGTFQGVVTTEVSMNAVSDSLLQWYLETDEPRGKAGGYAIQGAGSMFISGVRGSLSNVVGLPLREVRDALRHLRLV
ncbi:MAG: Maf family protein, partial [Planctomycetaceae bacterium]|nr:Maf family protein [Planctomycetaceae bacterium]